MKYRMMVNTHKIAKTLGQAIEFVAQDFQSTDLFYGHGTDNAYDEAAWLVLAKAGLSPLQSGVDPNMPLTVNLWQAIETLVRQRILTRKPLAYLLQSAWFCGLELYVDERVLVPRSPIAELIENQYQPWLTSDAQADVQILDMCTGSACIAIATARYCEDSHVDACDISADALTVAKMNIEKHHLLDRVSLYQTDLFQGLPAKQYDLIVSNPPYVDAEDMAQLSPEFCREPVLGLAAGEDGLDYVRRLLVEAAVFLKPHGGMILEVGNSRSAMEQAFPDLPLIWLDFDYGGEGVCFLHAADLKQR